MLIASARNCIKPQKENTAFQNKKEIKPKSSPQQKNFNTKKKDHLKHPIKGKMYQNKTLKNEA